MAFSHQHAVPCKSADCNALHAGTIDNRACGAYDSSKVESAAHQYPWFNHCNEDPPALFVNERSSAPGGDFVGDRNLNEYRNAGRPRQHEDGSVFPVMCHNSTCEAIHIPRNRDDCRGMRCAMPGARHFDPVGVL
jgi:hypothetical protein